MKLPTRSPSLPTPPSTQLVPFVLVSVLDPPAAAAGGRSAEGRSDRHPDRPHEGLAVAAGAVAASLPNPERTEFGPSVMRTGTCWIVVRRHGHMVLVLVLLAGLPYVHTPSLHPGELMFPP